MRRLYYGVTGESSEADLHREFVAAHFADREEYEGYCREFEDGEAAAVRAPVFGGHRFADPDAVSGGIDTPSSGRCTRSCGNSGRPSRWRRAAATGSPR